MSACAYAHIDGLSQTIKVQAMMSVCDTDPECNSFCPDYGDFHGWVSNPAYTNYISYKTCGSAFGPAGITQSTCIGNGEIQYIVCVGTCMEVETLQIINGTAQDVYNACQSNSKCAASNK